MGEGQQDQPEMMQEHRECARYWRPWIETSIVASDPGMDCWPELGYGLSACVDPLIILVLSQRRSKHEVTFALQRPNVTVLPAQLRTSWAKRAGSESSLFVGKLENQEVLKASYDHTPIYPNDKVKPWLNTKLQILVSQDLKSKGAMVRVLGW